MIVTWLLKSSWKDNYWQWKDIHSLAVCQKKSYVQNNTSVMSSAGMGQGKMANFSVYFVKIKFYFMDSVP